MKKILLFHFFPGGAGKFIANCLSFSQQVAVSNFQFALKFNQTKDLSGLDQLLLDTIPDHDLARQWLFLEHGCEKLFGNDIMRIKRNNDPVKAKLNNLDALGSVWLPLITHDQTAFDNCAEYFSKDQVFKILVDSTPEFIDLAIRKKWPEQHHCLDIEKYQVFKNNLKNMHFDMVIPDWNPLIPENLTQILLLAKRINVDFSLQMAKTYIEKYQNFHTK
jgi:hypothetical protein